MPLRVSCYPDSRRTVVLCSVPTSLLYCGRSVFVARHKYKDLFLYFFCDVSTPLSGHDLLVAGVWRKSIFWGAFAKFRKAIIWFAAEKLVCRWTDLVTRDIWKLFVKSAQKVQVCLKSDKNNMQFTRRHISLHLLPVTTSTQVFLGFPVPISKRSDGSQHSKLPLHASHVALPT